MKIVIICVLATLAVVACCSPAPGVNSAQKPGTCYRPGRYRRSLENEDAEGHNIVKRQSSFGGSQGGNGLVPSYGGSGGGFQGGNLKPTAPPPRPTPPPRPQCYRDYDCSGNKKCCSGVCQTPSFVG